MFISPYFWGCKYTNYFLFINKNIEIQHLGLLITCILMSNFGNGQRQETMETERKWIIVRIDGKIAAVSADYRMLASITARLAQKDVHYNEISATSASFEQVWNLRKEVCWEDLLLFGTDFQKSVWRRLYDLTHSENKPDLISYSDFAELCQNRAGVRAVAHAIGLNPVSVIIPVYIASASDF